MSEELNVSYDVNVGNGRTVTISGNENDVDAILTLMRTYGRPEGIDASGVASQWKMKREEGKGWVIYAEANLPGYFVPVGQAGYKPNAVVMKMAPQLLDMCIDIRKWMASDSRLLSFPTVELDKLIRATVLYDEVQDDEI